MTAKASTTSVATVYLVLCLTLGGASAAGAVANGLLQLLAVGIILAELLRTRGQPFRREAKTIIAIWGLFLALGCLYLVPIPADIWRKLDSRTSVYAGFILAGVVPPSLPVSLAPRASISSLLSLLPPAAIFLLTLKIGAGGRMKLAWMVVIMAVFSIALGAFQMVGGEHSPLRFYDITNRNAPVGFFANTNHLATLVLSGLPLTGLMAAKAAGRRRAANSMAPNLILSITIALFLLVGIGVIGSLAGFGLVLPAAVMAVLIYKRAKGPLPGQWWLVSVSAFLLFMALAFVGPLNQQALSDKFGDQPRSRKVIAQVSSDAILDFAPLGSGLGTFADVYRAYDPPERASKGFVNHAHNDYIEIALELGFPGLLIVLAFFTWWLQRTLHCWRSEFEGVGLARAGTVIIGIIVMHSVVDYPIRTAAISAVFAWACALLIQPIRAGSNDPKLLSTSGEEGLRHLSVK